VRPPKYTLGPGVGSVASHRRFGGSDNAITHSGLRRDSCGRCRDHGLQWLFLEPGSTGPLTTNTSVAATATASSSSPAAAITSSAQSLRATWPVRPSHRTRQPSRRSRRGLAYRTVTRVVRFFGSSPVRCLFDRRHLVRAMLQPSRPEQSIHHGCNGHVLLRHDFECFTRAAPRQPIFAVVPSGWSGHRLCQLGRNLVVDVIANSSEKKDNRSIPFNKIQDFALEVKSVGAPKINFTLQCKNISSPSSAIALVQGMTVTACRGS
jgi:hypothetical protein